MQCWRLQWRVLWKDDLCFLYPESLPNQHSASGPADHLWDTSCLLCWNVLPRCLALCMALSGQPVHQLSATLSSVASTYCFGLSMWKNLLAAYVPVSAEVYMCSSPSFLEVYREKTWLSWPAKVTQQQLIMLFSTCVSMWIGGWSASVGMCVMAAALG